MVVLTIHQNHLTILVLEIEAAIQPTETTPENHHSQRLVLLPLVNLAWAWRSSLWHKIYGVLRALGGRIAPGKSVFSPASQSTLRLVLPILHPRL